MEVVAYRVVLEAVTNVARHAGVDGAQVAMTLDDPGQMVITVAGAGSRTARPRPETGRPVSA